MNNEQVIKVQDPSERLLKSQTSPGSADMIYAVCLYDIGSYKTWERLF